MSRVDEADVRIRMAKRPGLGFIQARNELLAERAMSRRQRRAFRERIKRLADEDWNAIASEVDPLTHAKRHLAAMTPERRAELNAEWDAPTQRRHAATKEI